MAAIDVYSMLEEWEECPVELGDVIDEFCEGYVEMSKFVIVGEGDCEPELLGWVGNVVVFIDNSDDEIYTINQRGDILCTYILGELDIGRNLFIRLVKNHILVGGRKGIIDIEIDVNNNFGITDHTEFVAKTIPWRYENDTASRYVVVEGMFIQALNGGGNVCRIWGDFNLGCIHVGNNECLQLSCDFRGIIKYPSFEANLKKKKTFVSGKKKLVLEFIATKTTICVDGNNGLDLIISIDDEENFANIIVVTSVIRYIYVRDGHCVHDVICCDIAADWGIVGISHAGVWLKAKHADVNYVINWAYKPKKLCI